VFFRVSVRFCNPDVGNLGVDKYSVLCYNNQAKITRILSIYKGITIRTSEHL